MTYSIYDELEQRWLLCQYDEDSYDTACEVAQHMNIAYNKKLSEYKQMKRYSVKAIEEGEVQYDID